MAVRRKRVDMSMAVAAIRVQVGELAASLCELNDGLQALAGQIGRFGQLSQALGAPGAVTTPVVHLPPHPPNPNLAGPHSLSAQEIAQREALLQTQFPRRRLERPDIERDLAEGGDA